MKLGIIGTGNVGEALCKSLTHKGYHVMVGSRTPEKAIAVANRMEHFAQGGTIASAIHYGEIVILAVPYKAIEEVLRSTDSFRGKIVIDCTNPFMRTPGGVELALGHTTSAAEQIARMIPEARVVKAFNTAFARHMASGPYFGANDGTMFYCGDDADAKEAAARIIAATGFEPVDCGALTSARYLEPMAALIVRLGMSGMGDDIAFKLLRRS
ncbi:MAG: NAD(P)-binding domain-containing protein [Bacteroidia bacterium]